MIPLAPIPFIAFGALVSHVAQIRGHVIDAYETEIRTLIREYDGDGDSLSPYGHTILNRRVWQSYYARVVIGVNILVLGPIYIAILIEAYQNPIGEKLR